jgi:hypothetical protein
VCTRLEYFCNTRNVDCASGLTLCSLVGYYQCFSGTYRESPVTRMLVRVSQVSDATSLSL